MGDHMVVDDYRSTNRTSKEDYVIYLMLMATYRWAESFVRGKRVLDFGCGPGYGSNFIAASADSVVGVDVSPESLDHAARTYTRANLAFDVIDTSCVLPYEDKSFDVVMSFQVFEHVEFPQRYLQESRRVLKPGGVLLLVTPDRSTRLFRGQRPWNRWHLTEYSERRLDETVRGVFSDVEMLKMSGRKDVIAIELRRCQRMKWFTLPFTLPIYPDALRPKVLKRVQAMRGRARRDRPQLDFDFDESTIHFGANLEPSLNLAVVARV
jgi:SAM-dependent methyltransferase